LKNFLPYSRQNIDDDDIAAVADVLRSDFLTTGPKVIEFETAFSEVVNAKHSLACSSGTAGLHIAASATGLSSGEEAIVPAITFLSTANSVRFTGAEVVFADVDPNTGLMTPKTADAALARAKNARAILPVHLNGQCCDMATLKPWADQKDLVVIEDACHVLGGRYEDGNLIGGGSGRITVFSAHPVKTIAMGEGGIITTDNSDMAKILLRFRNHGMVRDPKDFTALDQAFAPDGNANPWYYEMNLLGFNYRASDIHCALGLSQLSKLKNFVQIQNQLVESYAERLAPLAPIVQPVTRTGLGVPAWHVATVLIDFDQANTDRATVMKELGKRGVGSQVLYMPLTRQPYYKKRYGKQHLPGAEAYYAKTLCLPLFASMTDGDIDRIVDALSAALQVRAT
tara:strand:- start:777 stop:1970 length:1194 start_codon:yes stop_codon:yes gene_type:complete